MISQQLPLSEYLDQKCDAFAQVFPGREKPLQCLPGRSQCLWAFPADDCLLREPKIAPSKPGNFTAEILRVFGSGFQPLRASDLGRRAGSLLQGTV